MEEYIKNLLKTKLFESKKNRKNEYGCVMLFLYVNKKDWKNLEQLIVKLKN
jgi:hypothetical protein